MAYETMNPATETKLDSCARASPLQARGEKMQALGEGASGVSTPSNHELRSFVHVASASAFPIQNLPYGIFRPQAGASPRVGVAIGAFVLDLSVLARHGLLGEDNAAPSSCFRQQTLNDFMSRGREFWRRTRTRLQHLLSDDVSTLKDDFDLRARAFHRMEDAVMEVPAVIGDFTDFYSSKNHAMNVGALFRGNENALPTNWLHLPIAYHGRSSSILISGKEIARPKGQMIEQNSKFPIFRQTQILDFELEVGFFVGPGNEVGTSIRVDDAYNHIFGLVLVNDWSARDIQKWEYVPLGPFLGKNFATSISPWIVTLEALEPFITSPPKHEIEVLPYLKESSPKTYDINLEVYIVPDGKKERSKICETNFRYLYWTMGQQIAHHTINGCNLMPGDLVSSGTISGDGENSLGSLIELTHGGKKNLCLRLNNDSDSNSGSHSVNGDNCATRTFLLDGDEVIMTGFCQGDGYRIGFGECSGKIVPSL